MKTLLFVAAGLAAAAPLIVLSPSSPAAPGGNQPPVCVVTAQGNVLINGSIVEVPIQGPTTSVVLDASGSFDPDGDPITFDWAACPNTSFSDPNAAVTTLTAQTPPGSDFLCGVRCLVKDPSGALSPDNCRLFVRFFENQPPQCVVAQSAITVQATGSSVTVPLDACASFDPDPGQTALLTYQWFGCPGTTFSAPTACATDVTLDLTGVTLPFVCGIRVVVKDPFGVQSQDICRVLITVEPGQEYCSLTQGFYGNAGGKYKGTATLPLIESLLAQGDVVLGYDDPAVAGDRSLTIGSAAANAQCVIDRLPAGGTPTTLPAGLGHVTLSTATCQDPGGLIPLKQNGGFDNNLLGQTLALSLNVRLPGSAAPLADLGLCPSMSSTELGTFADGGGTTIAIPDDVFTALANLGLGATVGGLLELANRHLGGLDTAPASASEIDEAVDGINRLFDECASLVTCE